MYLQPEEMRPPVPGKDHAAESTYQRVVRELGHGRYVDVSKDTQFSEAWFLLSVLLSIVGVIVNNAFLLGIATALGVAAAVGWGWNRLSLYGLHYERRFSEVRAFLGETVELTLEVRNLKFLPLTWLDIIDVFPATLPVDGARAILKPLNNLGEYHSFWTVGVFQRLTRRLVIQCVQRGYHPFGPASIATGDGFGLFSRRATLPGRQRLIVYPRLYTAAELGLPAKNPFGLRSGHDPLLEDPMRTAGIREWQPVDSVRRVHWKATARHQQMLSRLYEPSEEPQVLIFLNVATLRRHWEGNIPELMERAISVAGSLAAVVTEQRLPVGLIANGFLPGSDQPLRLLPGRSPAQLVHILELLAAVTAFATQPIEELLLREAPRLPWGATLLLVTAAVYDDLLAVLVELGRAGRQIVLFTLAEEPPAELGRLTGITVYHLPHLVEDLIAPHLLQGGPPNAFVGHAPDTEGSKDAAR